MLFDNDELLGEDVDGVQVGSLSVRVAGASGETCLLLAAREADVLVVNIAQEGVAEVLDAARRENVLCIALVEAGHEDAPLEHALVRWELRGFDRALPKPIDGVELVLAAADLAASRRLNAGHYVSLRRELARRIGLL